MLIVDDDPAIVDSLGRALELEGYVPSAAADGTSALEAVGEDQPDAIILDVGLPDLSGRVVAARLRAADVTTPILILSALDQVDDRIAGLEAGADDYLIKPFAMEELVARLRALLRRRGQRGSEAEIEGVASPIRIGELLVDPDGHSASWAGQDLGLTRRELALIEVFARNPGVVLGRDRLLELVWGYDFSFETKVVDVFVSYLRRKLKAAGAPRLIATVRGVGFVLERP